MQYLNFFVTPKKFGTFYGMPLYELVGTYFPEFEKKKSMATEPEGKWCMYGWFGCISPETKEVRLNIVKDIIKELEGDYIPLYTKWNLISKTSFTQPSCPKQGTY